VFTKGIKRILLPVRHGEGKFYTDEETLKRIISQNQVAVKYCDPDTGEPAEGKFSINPNGSLEDIAGICDETGRIFMLMPHPEAYNHFTNHPTWTREKYFLDKVGKQIENREGLGIQIFRNAVQYVEDKLL
jgi:phosphoribosylformylglycinamidine synthase